ncbi:large ribosomal subunit protein uL15m-like isoform X2 [Tigriopus californicus]|nr:large ribosomal subunit protein uL15m-like isoform X2 [Tigriopus californicus]
MFKIWSPLGWEGGSSPIFKTTPVEVSYNYGYHAQRQYPPMSLKTLQLLIDTGRLDTHHPIDLATLCQTKVYRLDPNLRQFGVHLTAEGMDGFKAKVHLEVQWASQEAIAAVERNGGSLVTAYFDIFSVKALADPIAFFKTGQPIPRRLTPPADAVGYYMNPANRGYLADPTKVAEERVLLAQKFGYSVPPLDDPVSQEAQELIKDPRQVFYGLQPGWIVSLADKRIYKPLDEELVKHYNS